MACDAADIDIREIERVISHRYRATREEPTRHPRFVQQRADAENDRTEQQGELIDGKDTYRATKEKLFQFARNMTTAPIAFGALPIQNASDQKSAEAEEYPDTEFSDVHGGECGFVLHKNAHHGEGSQTVQT